MRRVALLASFLAVPLAAAACAQGSTGGGLGTGGGTGGGSSTVETGGGGTGGSSSGGSAPTSCAQASGYAGCCEGTTFYYCKGDGGVTPKHCTNGQTCGWDTTAGYYGCVAPPGLADPSGTHPLACQ